MAGRRIGGYGLVDEVHDLSEGGQRTGANGARERRQSIFLTGRAAGHCMTFWQDSASALRGGRTVCAECQEYSLPRRIGCHGEADAHTGRQPDRYASNNAP